MWGRSKGAGLVANERSIFSLFPAKWMIWKDDGEGLKKDPWNLGCSRIKIISIPTVSNPPPPPPPPPPPETLARKIILKFSVAPAPPHQGCLQRAAACCQSPQITVPALPFPFNAKAPSFRLEFCHLSHKTFFSPPLPVFSSPIADAPDN